MTPNLPLPTTKEIADSLAEQIAAQLPATWRLDLAAVVGAALAQEIAKNLDYRALGQDIAARFQPPEIHKGAGY
ncbi:MAG: hypothetical protein V4510_06445 [bacterium]